MDWWEAALLGLIQGLTEFLPISSSGHLVLGKYLLGLNEPGADDVAFEIFVHFGTVLSIITVYYKKIGDLIGSGLKAVAAPHRVVEENRKNESLRTVFYILITLVPTGLVYILLKDFLEAKFNDPRFV